MKKIMLILFLLLAVGIFFASCPGPGQELSTYTVSYDANNATGGTAPADQTKTEGTNLTLAANSGNLAKTGYTFAGWNTADDGSGTHYGEEASYSTDADLMLYAEWKVNPGAQQTFTADSVTFKMNLVPGNIPFPTGIDDLGTPATVSNTYWIGETEVTYELWNVVHTWATSNGYTFANAGTMGDGTGDTDQHPVTTINWRDAMVWCNALTEWYNTKEGTSYNQVYYSDSTYTTPLRDSSDGSYDNSINKTDGSFDQPYIKAATDGNTDMANCTADGFRLVTTDEWEFAARWRDDSTNTVPGYSDPWFTQGDSASGATADYSDPAATGAVAWYNDNSDSSTHELKEKTANALGLYDMSGNVWEWCFDWEPSGSYRMHGGGAWFDNPDYLRVGGWYANNTYVENRYIGFRFARTP